MSASPQLRGFLRLYLGAAAGVGKTYQMLGDARLAAEEGADLVIGYLEPHGRVATEERARGLERAPLLRFGSGGRAETEVDVDWLIERRPSVAIIDELAHTNATGSARRKRYEDIGVLLDSGIDVWTTVNIQHLESLNGRIRTLTGVEVRETFPDRLLHEADEIKLVDLSPASLRERIARGLVYPVDRCDAARLGGLRDLGGQVGAARREVDQEGSVGHRVKRALRPDDDLADVVRGADHDAHHLGVGRRLPRRGSPLGSTVHELARAFAGAREHPQAMSGIEQVPAHRAPHDPRADPGDVGHGCPESIRDPPPDASQGRSVR